MRGFHVFNPFAVAAGWPRPQPLNGGIPQARPNVRAAQPNAAIDGALLLVAARVRSTTGGYVFTGVSLSTGDGGTTKTTQGVPPPPPTFAVTQEDFLVDYAFRWIDSFFRYSTVKWKLNLKRNMCKRDPAR